MRDTFEGITEGGFDGIIVTRGTIVYGGIYTVNFGGIWD